MNMEELIASLGIALGLPGLKLNREGCARLLFDERIAVNLEADAERCCLHLHSVLGPVPGRDQSGRDNLMYSLLKGNLFGQRTGSSILAIDSAREEFVIFRTLEVHGMDARKLADVLSVFVDFASEWMAKVDSKLEALNQERAERIPVIQQEIDMAGFLRA